MVESDSARDSFGFVLAFIASTSASMSDGFNRSSGIAPNGGGSRCLRDRFAYNARVDSLRSDAARPVTAMRQPITDGLFGVLDRRANVQPCPGLVEFVPDLCRVGPYATYRFVVPPSSL